MTAGPQSIGFGGGCHWCTEAVFQSLDGVSDVEQGFIASVAPDDSYSEAVRLTFDPARISLDVLIDVHLTTHASTSDHSMRGKYRSAIYTLSDQQHREVKDRLAYLQQSYEERLVTRALPLKAFRPSDQRFHNYYRTDQERPFCRVYIRPKLEKLKRLGVGLVQD